MTVQLTAAVPVARRVGARIGYSGALYALTYLAMVVAALVPAPIVFLVGVALSYVAGWLLYRRPWFPHALARLRLPVAQRFALREVFAVVLLLRMRPDSLTAVAALVGGVVAIQVLRGLYNAAREQVRRSRGCRFSWKNLHVEHVPQEWPRLSAPGLGLFDGDSVRTMLHADVLLVLGAPLVALGLPEIAMPVLAGVACLLALVPPAALAAKIVSLRYLPDEDQVLRRLRVAVERLAPEVAVYFSAPQGSTYQLNVWMPTLNRSHRPTLIILREAHHLDSLAETQLPVVVLPRAEDVAWMHVPSLRGAIYSTNVIKNNDMLRLAGIRSTFIIHGDSDKKGSFNPVSRGYDEIWVAGEAGRARYARTREGIRPEQVFLVGRPQLADIEQAGSGVVDTEGVRTVLYAPTWEGFFEASDYSSVLTMGDQIVRELLAMDVRVLFKRHPATGTRVPGYLDALSVIEQRVAEATNGSAVVQDTDGLYAAFNKADILVADISSVATDFLYSVKPLIVTNPWGMADDSFVEEFPSTEAAYRIGPGCSGLAEAIRLATGSDPLHDARLRMRTYLLGDYTGDPVERFVDEIDRLVERNDYAAPAGTLRRLALASEERADRSPNGGTADDGGQVSETAGANGDGYAATENATMSGSDNGEGNW